MGAVFSLPGRIQDIQWFISKMDREAPDQLAKMADWEVIPAAFKAADAERERLRREAWEERESLRIAWLKERGSVA